MIQHNTISMVFYYIVISDRLKELNINMYIPLFFQLIGETDDYNKILLNIDNTRMTAEDFKMK